MLVTTSTISVIAVHYTYEYTHLITTNLNYFKACSDYIYCMRLQNAAALMMEITAAEDTYSTGG